MPSAYSFWVGPSFTPRNYTYLAGSPLYHANSRCTIQMNTYLCAEPTGREKDYKRRDKGSKKPPSLDSDQAHPEEGIRLPRRS